MMKDTRIIAIANNKGGVGKTTTAASLGALLARAGHRVLMVDLDGQRSLTRCFIGYEPERTVYDAFTGPKDRALVKGCVVCGEDFDNPVEGLDLLPSSARMGALDTELAGRTSRETFLTKILRALDVARTYDYVFVDCPPALGLATVNALAACNELYVPTTAEYMPIEGLKDLIDKCAEVAEDLNPDLAITGVLITRFTRCNLSEGVERALRDHFGDRVFKTRIRQNVRVAECPQARLDICAYAPDSNGAADYAALAQEVMERTRG